MRWHRRPLLRPAGFDDLGLRQALSGRILLCLVAGMAFLAALSLGGAAGASALARHWRIGVGAVLTVQVPNPQAPNPAGGGQRNRLDQVLDLLRATPGVVSARALSDDELAELLRPWLGRNAERIALPLPAVIDIHLADGAQIPTDLAGRLRAAAPGTLMEDHGPWMQRLAALTRSLQASAVLVLALVIAVAVGVVAVATRAGLAVRREAIDIVHALGATDGFIAARFAGRITWLAALGGLIGSVLSLPFLASLAWLARPLTADPAIATSVETSSTLTAETLFGALPPAFWFLLPGLPAATGLIGWLTTQITVRGWLRQLP